TPLAAIVAYTTLFRSRHRFHRWWVLPKAYHPLLPKSPPLLIKQPSKRRLQSLRLQSRLLLFVRRLMMIPLAPARSALRPVGSQRKPQSCFGRQPLSAPFGPQVVWRSAKQSILTFSQALVRLLNSLDLLPESASRRVLRYRL